MPNKNILIISASEVFPTITGGTVHTGGVAKSLQRMGYTVRLYCIAARRESYGKGGGHSVVEIEPGLTQETNLNLSIGLLQTLARRLGMPRIWQFWMLRLGWVPGHLKQASAWADTVICDMPHTAPLPDHLRSCPWYLMSHDLTWRQLAQSGFKERLWTSWMRRVETKAPQRYTDIIAVTREDRDFFQQYDHSGQLVLPIIGSSILPANYDISDQIRRETRESLGIEADQRVVLFSGSHFGPNIKAMDNILAYCKAHDDWLQTQRICILIVGSISHEAYRRGALIATGPVDRIEPYFGAADAGFNPVLSGSGANVKLFEYLAARLPVISTEFGVRGSELAAPRDYILCGNHDFTAAFETLLAQSPEHWKSFCEDVWQRHKHYCDIGEQTREAVEALPDFA